MSLRPGINITLPGLREVVAGLACSIEGEQLEVEQIHRLESALAADTSTRASLSVEPTQLEQQLAAMALTELEHQVDGLQQRHAALLEAIGRLREEIATLRGVIPAAVFPVEHLTTEFIFAGIGIAVGHARVITIGDEREAEALIDHLENTLATFVDLAASISTERGQRQHDLQRARTRIDSIGRVLAHATLTAITRRCR